MRPPGEILFLGTDAGAACCLQELVARSFRPRVVTPPDRRRGRRGPATPTAVRAAAEELGLSVVTAANVNVPEIVAELSEPRPELLVVVAFGQILREGIRGIPRLGCLNLHFSLLPRWRGAAPVQRAILAGDTETGVCVQRLVAALDAGDVLAVESEEIRPRDDARGLRERLIERGAPLLCDVVQRLLAGETLAETEQDVSQVTLAPKIWREEGVLDFVAEDATALDRRVRGLIEWPGCRVVLHRAIGGAVPVIIHETTPESGTGEPGCVVSVDGDGIVVAAREGLLRITRLQKEGKRVMPMRDFLNGCPVATGDRLLPA